METLIPLKLPVGFYRNGTKYQGSGRWIDGNLIRFHEGMIRPVGGWSQALDTAGGQVQVSGKPRCAVSWKKNDATAWLGVGTLPGKLYAFSAGVLSDITPVGLTAGVVDGTIATGTGLYGGGLYGGGLYGGASLSGTFSDADTWSLDNFGEILLACLTADGKIYESTPTAVGVQVTNSPTARAVVVTPERFVFALGASGDPRNVAWCAQSNRTLWAPAASNNAGSFPLQTVGRIITGRRADRETLIWTDSDLWSAVFVGGNLVHAFTRRGENCGLIGPNAVTMAEGTAFWMGDNQFFSYTGAVRSLPCEVSDYVFGNFNRTQRAKIQAVPNTVFGEVTWYYPSATQSGLENDRYVTINYRSGAWMTGTVGRAAGVGASVFTNPQLWAQDGKLYTHETGFYHDGFPAFIETGPLELGNGDQVVRLQQLVPDEASLGQVLVTVISAFQPMATETAAPPCVLAPLTECRQTGRQFRFRFAEPITGSALTADSTLISADATSSSVDGGPGPGTDFRIGNFRAGVIAGGKR